jgi:hypothetical protein
LTPIGNKDESGKTSIETSVAGVTASAADPVTDPELAEMVALPVDMPVAKPDPATVATAVADELQLTEFVRSRELPSLNTPLAVNCWVVPAAIDVEPGRTLIETSVAGVTLKLVDPKTAPDIAVILVLPPPTLEAIPELLIVATALTVELQVTPVRTWVLPSLNVPVAVNCCPAP